MKKPLVSIILPTYNRLRLLNRALDCIEQQTFKDYEVIVVNDAGRSAEKVLSNYSNIVYLEHSVNKGLAASRNTGIIEARGKYITYQDDDDIWFEDHLETLVEHLESLPNIQAAFTDCYKWYEEHFLFSSEQKSGDIGKVGRMVVAIICLMHEKQLLKEVGYFDEEMRCMEDWDFIIRMNRQTKILHIPKFTAAYSKRMDIDQLSTDADKMKKAYDIIRERYGIDPPKYRSRLL